MEEKIKELEKEKIEKWTELEGVIEEMKNGLEEKQKVRYTIVSIMIFRINYDSILFLKKIYI